MDGTGIYQAIAAVFLCQLYGIDLSLTETILLAFTMIGASIGTPAIPGVGIVILATIVTGLGVPPEGIGLIFSVDRILDMCRTSINVMGDLVAGVVMNRWVKAEI
jgi:proton glutamate symport protein